MFNVCELLVLVKMNILVENVPQAIFNNLLCDEIEAFDILTKILLIYQFFFRVGLS